MWIQARAILWAQWRTLVNFYSRGRLGALIFAILISVLWYGLAAVGGFACAVLASDPKRVPLIHRAGPGLLMFVLFYWQIVPILLTSTGASLDLRRLIVYPIRHAQLFGVEVLLRITTGIEMLLVMAGCAIGLWINPRIPWWGPFVFLPWIGLNLTLSAGLKGLLGRLLARRRIREIAILLLVLLAALPQLLLITGLPVSAKPIVSRLDGPYLPWNVVTRLALGGSDLLSWIALAAWTAAAFTFGWWQFHRDLRFDAEAARAQSHTDEPPSDWLDWLYRIPSRLAPDPIGALFEKEVRFLSRAPRFRIVFLMGFTFSLIIWLPIAFRGGEDSFLRSNYLTLVTLYSLMLLGEVSFWNNLGFDRSAVQNYFVFPVRFTHVLIAKNLTCLLFVLLEIAAVATVCALVGMPITLARVLEALAVALVLTLFLVAVGNLGSVYFPRPADPKQSWRNASASRFQALLLVVHPLCAAPVVLAYLARYAFESQAAFYGVLGVSVLVGVAFYWVSLETAVDAAARRTEDIVTALSQGEGPVAA